MYRTIYYYEEQLDIYQSCCTSVGYRLSALLLLLFSYKFKDYLIVINNKKHKRILSKKQLCQRPREADLNTPALRLTLEPTY